MNRPMLFGPKLALMLAVVTGIAGCSGNRPPDGIVPEKKMVELLIDTHLTDAVLYMDNSATDIKRDKALYYYPSLLDKHGVTKAEMDSSVAWYMRHPDAYARVYAQVMQDLEKRQAAEKKPEKTEE